MRSIVSSIFLMVVAALVATGGGLYATFTNSDAETGSVVAGNAQIRLNLLHGVNEMVWDLTCDNENMSPGEVCEATLTVYNIGSVWLDYSVSPIETACFDVSFTGPFDTIHGGDGIFPGRLPPPGLGPGGGSDQETINATVELVGGDECQGLTEFVGILVEAESIPTP